MRNMSPLAKFALALIALWVLFGVIGFVVKALFWLFVIACIGFGFTLAVTAHRRGLIGRR